MGAKILLVEDDEYNSDMLSKRLIKKGYEVVIAETGEKGLELAETTLPTIILMDVGLPLMDGWEATLQLKKNPKTKDIPVLALTAHSMVGDRETAIKSGCDDYDTKPIDFPRLLEKIEKLVKNVKKG
jgi:two-component system cell cycle response regulator DivK